MAKDCPSGAQKQTVVKDKKMVRKQRPETTRKSNKKSTFRDRKTARPNKYTCKLCMKKNHTITYCKLFRKAREILKEQGNTLNVLAMAEEDANMQALNPVREALIDQLDWEAAQIDEEELEGVVTALLQMEELYDSGSSSSSEDEM